MFWSRLNKRRDMTPAERFIAEHSAFLSRALSGPGRYPRIPVRPMSRGGFDRVRQSPDARERADRWWSLALDRVDEAD